MSPLVGWVMKTFPSMFHPNRFLIPLTLKSLSCQCKHFQFKSKFKNPSLFFRIFIFFHTLWEFESCFFFLFSHPLASCFLVHLSFILSFQLTPFPIFLSFYNFFPFFSRSLFLRPLFSFNYLFIFYTLTLDHVRKRHNIFVTRIFSWPLNILHYINLL